MSKSRAGYEFGVETKRLVRRRQDRKCLITNKKNQEAVSFEFHHILPIAVAREHFPHLLPEVVRSEANCVMLSHEVHVQVHQDLSKRTAEQRWEYFKAMAEVLHEHQQLHFLVVAA